MATSLHVLFVRGIVFDAVTSVAMAVAAVAIGEVSPGFMVGLVVLGLAVGAAGEYVLSFLDWPRRQASPPSKRLSTGGTLLP